MNDLSNILGTARIVNYNITGIVDIRSDGEQKKLERVNTDYIIDAKLFLMKNFNIRINYSFCYLSRTFFSIYMRFMYHISQKPSAHARENGGKVHQLSQGTSRRFLI